MAMRPEIRASSYGGYFFFWFGLSLLGTFGVQLVSQRTKELLEEFNTSCVECAICFDDVTSDTRCRTPCFHFYHKNCLARHFFFWRTDPQVVCFVLFCFVYVCVCVCVYFQRGYSVAFSMFCSLILFFRTCPSLPLDVCVQHRTLALQRTVRLGALPRAGKKLTSIF